MADNGGLNDAGAADGEKDLVADFLMREQDKLAGLEDDFGMNDLNSVVGVTIHRIGPHRATPDRTGPHRARTEPEMTGYFTSTTVTSRIKA